MDFMVIKFMIIYQNNFSKKIKMAKILITERQLKRLSKLVLKEQNSKRKVVPTHKVLSQKK